MNNLTLFKDIQLSDVERSRNILITGIPGVGVSKYLLNLINQDINAGSPVILFDQYGDLCDEIISSSSDELLQKTAYIDVGNIEFPVGINIFENNDEYGEQEVSNLFINLMYDLYDPNRTGIIGPRFEHAVRNAILTISYDENVSFIELLRCLTDASYVKNLLPKVKDPVVLNYWNNQIAQTSDFHKSEVLDYIISKLSIFVTDKMMRNILGQTKSTVNFKTLLSDYKVVLFNFRALKKYKDANKVITTLFMFKLLKELKLNSQAINIYIDEAVTWPAVYVSELLTENRRYGITVTLTSNKINDASPSLKSTLIKTGTLISFRLYSDDAKFITPEFHNQNITIDKLCLLKKYFAYVKTLEDGNVLIKEEPLSFELNTPGELNQNKIKEFKNNSKQKYGVEVKLVEENIQSRMK
jgi:hypothetical protein